ncbi:alpha/beta-hydrolase [Polychaeton citri CBS 116435]|uniref:Alpha/beta-hydrolase n=1 Tax=Polychaeton citri CBS 116435 TaxID=1314669 RepID=A0A9P4Q6J9_9PEZI|nr:alpha/beta-hydrolase [Polychaeton citri CBS 116435]
MPMQLTMTAIKRQCHPSTQLSYLHNYDSTLPAHQVPSTAVIFIHGWRCQASNFTDLITNLSQPKEKQHTPMYGLIAIDLPGHGQSLASNCPDPTPKKFAALILGYIADLALERVILVGHSLGSRIVLEMWRQSYHTMTLKSDDSSLDRAMNTPRVVGLVFLDGSHFKFRPPDPGIISSPFPERESQALHKAFSTMFSSFTPVAFRDSALTHLDKLDTAYCKAMMDAHVAYDHAVTDGAVMELRRQRVPVLNIQSTDAEDGRRRLQRGEKNRWMRFLEEELGVGREGVLEEVLVEGAGHFPHIDQTVLVAEVLDAFARRVFWDKENSSGGQ